MAWVIFADKIDASRRARLHTTNYDQSRTLEENMSLNEIYYHDLARFSRSVF